MQFRSIGTHFRYRHDAVPSRSISAPWNAIKSHRFDILGYLGSNRLSYDGKNRERIREPWRRWNEILLFFFFSSFVTGIQAIGDYRSNTLTRGIPVYTSAKSRRIRRWLKRSTSSSRVSGSFEIVSVINRHCFAFEFSSSGSIRCSLKSY